MANHPDLFHDGRKTIPQHKDSPPNEVRIGLAKSDIGARKSHISHVHERGGKEFGIRHVGKT